MAAPTADTPPTFNWSDEEKALLRRTLRVRVLGDHRIELQAREPGYLPYRLLGIAIILAVSALTAPPDMNPCELGAPRMMLLGGLFAMLALPCFLPSRRRRSGSISLFPGTAWCVHHGSRRTDLERILPSTPRPADPPSGGVVLQTDVGKMSLAPRPLSKWDDRARCQGLLVERTCDRAPERDEPPPAALSLVDPAVLKLPRVFYAALLRYVEFDRIGTDTIELRTHYSSFRILAPLGLINLVILAVGGVLSFVNVPGIALGFLCKDNLAGVFHIPVAMVLGLPEGAVVAYLAWDSRRTLITLSKQIPYATLRSPLGETTIPSEECTFIVRGESVWGTRRAPSSGEVRELVVREYPVPTLVLLFLHHENKLARWEMNIFSPETDEERIALQTHLRGYLHAAEGKPAYRRSRKRLLRWKKANE